VAIICVIIPAVRDCVRLHTYTRESKAGETFAEEKNAALPSQTEEILEDAKNAELAVPEYGA
jgi:hypothetical protein